MLSSLFQLALVRHDLWAIYCSILSIFPDKPGPVSEYIRSDAELNYAKASLNKASERDKSNHPPPLR
ncbi:hypothetical protein [Fodinibius halophilus]|nr:hypothetical protein [Fodinibius halophilus]